MATSQADVVEYIKNLKLSEVKGLIEILEDELGVEASAPMMAMAAPAAGGGAAEAAEEKTEFDVILKAAGDKKIAVIKGWLPRTLYLRDSTLVFSVSQPAKR